MKEGFKKVLRIAFPQASRKQKIFFLLLMLSVFSCLLFTARVAHADTLYYGFLVWNLFLAWIPLCFSYWAYSIDKVSGSAWKLWTAGFFWFIFFPNAPYLITDFVHLHNSRSVPMWYDSLLVFSFALTGLLVGMVSLLLIHRIIEKKAGSIGGWIIIAVIFLASGFGIYIGRVLRWNSWDIIVNTFPLFNDISEHAISKTSFVMTCTFSCFIAISYLVVYYLLRIPRSGIVMK